MSEIKIGDTVKRVAGVHRRMDIGDIATVSDVWIADFGPAISLHEFTGVHSPEKFEIVTKPKTVADAYEKCKGLWPNKYCNDLYYDPKSGEWFCNDKPAPWYIFVCTREQFEAYAKEQEDKQEYPPLTQSLIDEAEQEADKWTHEYHGDNCKIIHQEKWQAWIVSEKGLSKLVHISELRKQKSALTKEQAWDYAVDSGLSAEEILKTHKVE